MTMASASRCSVVAPRYAATSSSAPLPRFQELLPDKASTWILAAAGASALLARSKRSSALRASSARSLNRRGRVTLSAASVEQAVDIPHAHAMVDPPCEIPPVYEIDEASRRTPEVSSWDDHGVRYYSLEKMFPEAPGIADAFDEDAEFRYKLRWATREDLYDPSSRFSKEVNDRIKGMDGTLLCALRHPQHIEEPRPCKEITKVLHDWGFTNLSGSTFMERLFSLCGEVSYKVQDREKASGSFSDIVTRGGGEHRWHQDSGWDKSTVLMGFPPEDRWEGVGVFSHIALLSHPLPVPDRPIPVVFSEMVCLGQRIPEEYVLRPYYKKGAEIVTYNDARTMHSAPDRIDRESLWRLQ